MRRVGPQHQAGSDSLLTMAVFFKMKRLYFEDKIDNDKYCGVLFGLGIAWTPPPPGAENGNVGFTGHSLLYASGIVNANSHMTEWTAT